MNCILDGSDYEELFIIAHGALTDSKNNNKPFGGRKRIERINTQKYSGTSDDAEG